MIELLLQADRLLTVDLVDAADAIYRKVADADPQNASAVVGMARCALARGDDHEAYRLAARAVAIDPRNDMARRMEARLDEVLRTRGEVPGHGAGATQGAAATQGPGASADAQPAAVANSTAAAIPVTQASAVEPRPPSGGSARSGGPPIPERPGGSAVPGPASPSPAASTRSLLDRLRGR